MDRTQAARRLFAGDTFATQTVGIVIEHAEDNYARCALEIRPEHLNANGQVMGGVLFTLADFAFAVAANKDGHANIVSLSAGIEFLKTAKGRRLVAETTCLKAGRNTCVLEVDIRDERDRLVAKARSTGLRLPEAAAKGEKSE